MIGIDVEDGSKNNKAHHNSIHGNTEYGIDASDNEGYTIYATNNWWGDASGPYHPSGNPDGEGDNITDNVDFDPWLAEAITQPDENGEEEPGYIPGFETACLLAGILVGSLWQRRKKGRSTISSEETCA